MNVIGTKRYFRWMKGLLATRKQCKNDDIFDIPVKSIDTKPKSV